MKKPRKRRYFGEATGKALAAFLNDRTRKRQTETTWSNADQVVNRPGADSDQVLLRLIELGQRCHASPNPHVRESLKRDANILLLDLKFNPVIVSIHGAWTVHWEAWKYDSPAAAVKLWLELVGIGVVSRLRRCARKKCRRWYYARFDHTSFHSIKCRDAAAKEDPTRRERRRNYERDYYHQFRKAEPKKRKGKL